MANETCTPFNDEFDRLLEEAKKSLPHRTVPTLDQPRDPLFVEVIQKILDERGLKNFVDLFLPEQTQKQ